MDLNINSIAVYDNSGAVDFTATEAKLNDTLATLKAKLLSDVATFAADQEQLGVAIEAVFDAHKGCKFNMPSLTSFALNELGALVTPGNHAALTARTLDYIRANCGEGKRYVSTKGRDGGVRRVCDIAAPESK